MPVFISHSRQNASAALKLCNELNHRNVETWLDVLDLESGAKWEERVSDAIRTAEALIFVMGPGEDIDTGQRFELQQVVEHEFYLESAKPLIPVLIGSVEIPGFLRVRKSITLDPASMDFAAAAAAVVTALGSPLDTMDEEKLQRGRDAREHALKNLREYVADLGIDDVKLAGLRALK